MFCDRKSFKTCDRKFSNFSLDQDIYSIDECFLDLAGFNPTTLQGRATIDFGFCGKMGNAAGNEVRQ